MLSSSAPAGAVVPAGSDASVLPVSVCSFDIVSLISEINHEFDVAIPAEEIIPENFNSAEALYSLIERLQDED